MTLSYIEHLEEGLKRAPPKQKGQRTRQRLKIATARVLEKKGYHAMRVADITARAKMAEGSFYVYFKDKADAALTVLREVLLLFSYENRGGTGEHSEFEAIRDANRRWITMCRANAGLMRCILQLGDEDPELAELAQQTNRQWYEVIAESSVRRRRLPQGRPAALLAAYLLGGLMDELVRKLVIYPDPGFLQVLGELRADDDDLADAASVLWLRVFYPDAALPADLVPAASALAEWMLIPRAAAATAGRRPAARRR